MKRFITTLLLIVALPVVAAAQVRTSYFMEGSTFRTDMNPALAPTRGYINMPVLGGLGVGVNNNFLSIDNMLYPTENGLVLFMNKAVDRNDFLKRLPRNNNLGISLSEQIIGFGAHTKRFFWSVGVNMKMDADVNIPKEFFSLITTLGQGSYNMKGMSVGANAYFETYIGAAVPIKDFITVGARLKGLIGVANASMGVTNMMVNVTDEYVSADFKGALQATCPVFNPNLRAGEAVDFENLMMGEDDIAQLITNPGRLFKSGGFAVDVGAEMRLLDDKLRLSASVIDLGFISWDQSASVEGTMGTAFSYEGVDIESGEAIVDFDEFEFAGRASTQKYAKRMNCSLNIGAEYAILRNRISFGLLSHSKFCQTYSFSELTASVNFKPLNWITATFSHTLLNKNQPGVFGFALNLHPAGLNIFLGADYIDLKMAPWPSAGLLLPIRQRSVNLNFGLGFSLGRAKYSKAYKADMEARQMKRSSK